MPDPIDTKLRVQSDEWEAGFAAARKTVHHFGDEVESTTERVKEKLEGLKSSFGRRGLLGEGLETLMGGGAIAGFGIALEAIDKVKEGIESYIEEMEEAATHEKLNREVAIEAAETQAEALNAVLGIQKEITREAERSAKAVRQSHETVAGSYETAGISDPIEKARAQIDVDASKKAGDIEAEERDKNVALADSGRDKIDELKKKLDKENAKDQEVINQIKKSVTGGYDAYGQLSAKDMDKINEYQFKIERRNASMANFEGDVEVKNQQAAGGLAKNRDAELKANEQERQARLDALSQEAQAKVRREVNDSGGLRAFSRGSEAAGLRAGGADEAQIKSAYELQKQVDGQLITQQERGAAIAEETAARKASAEQQIVNGITTEKASQDALIETMQRGAMVGGEVNKVLEQLALHKLPEEDAKVLLMQAAAADAASEHVKELAKAYESLRNATKEEDPAVEHLKDQAKAAESIRTIAKEAGNIQSLLSRGVDVKWVTQLASMGGAALNAEQLNQAISQLEKNEALDHLVTREKQAEDGLRSLGEKVDDLQALLDKGVDARYIQQLAGMGALNDQQVSQAEDRLKQEEKINNVISARKQIEDQTIALRAKQLNETVEEYKLRQQGDSVDADKLKALEMIGKQIDANRQLADREIESRNRDSNKEVRNHYAAIQSLNAIGGVSIPDDGSASGKAGGAGGPQPRSYYYQSVAVGAKEPSRPADDAGAVDPQLISFLRDIRNATLDNLAKVVQF